jgi:hypothetical protein
MGEALVFAHMSNWALFVTLSSASLGSHHPLQTVTTKANPS